MTYTVSTVWHEEIRGDMVNEVAKLDDKTEAMDLAKTLAGDYAGDCFTCGPTSLAYSGLNVTVVVAWK
jgi:hypothetical protein